ncbi:MAG: Deoxycytidine triphosphate deaminase, partial [uncultured Thermomicrobiales bacterium]
DPLGPGHSAGAGGRADRDRPDAGPRRAARLRLGRFSARADLHDLRAQPPSVHRPAPPRLDRRRDADDRGGRGRAVHHAAGGLRARLHGRVADAAGRSAGSPRGALQHRAARDHGPLHGRGLRAGLGRDGDDGAEQPGPDGGRALPGDADLRLLVRAGQLARLGPVPGEAERQVRRAADPPREPARGGEPNNRGRRHERARPV